MYAVLNPLDAASLLTSAGSLGPLTVLLVGTGLLEGALLVRTSNRRSLKGMAWALDVPAGTFALWQVAAGLAWMVGLSSAGFLLGPSIPSVDRYLLPILGIIVVVSLLPGALESRRSRRATVSPPRDRDGAVDW